MTAAGPSSRKTTVADGHDNRVAMANGDALVVPGPADLAELWLYHRVAGFYHNELGLLDGRRFDAWLALFTDDATYEVPIRTTTEEGGASEISSRGRIVWDTRASLGVRVARLGSGSAWAEQPPTRTRHHLAGLRVTSVSGHQVDTIANLLVYCNRGDDAGHTLYSAERRDRLVTDGAGGFAIRSRLVLLDQAVCSAPSLSVFL